RSPLERNDVGLRLIVLIQSQRILNAYHSSALQRRSEQIGRAIHTDHMAMTDRTHLDDLAFDELDSVDFSEDDGVRHSIVLVDGGATLLRCRLCQIRGLRVKLSFNECSALTVIAMA